jgi:hypothetical protein
MNKKFFQLQAEKWVCTKLMAIQMTRFDRTRKFKKSAQDFPPIKERTVSESGQNIEQYDDDHYL